MKAILFFSCCICLLLTSCSLPLDVRTDGLADHDKQSAKLLNIRIERGDILRFSGLLGVRENADGLHYVLLDATGVKLLEVEVAGDGSHNLLRGGGPLKGSDLAPFLSLALARIYLQEPQQLPCAGSWFYRLCREESEDKAWCKYGRKGPFKVWKVSGGGTSGQDHDTVVYHQPWLGVRIQLARVASGK